jgi:lipid A ethanolaminephosphotransferase
VLQQCAREAVVNAYDNSIAYTDHVLASAVAWLQRQRERHAPALLYVSDHGESLGENNIWLHGLPYAVAPREQTHVPMVLWLGARDGWQADCLQRQRDAALSHDNLFHVVLGLVGVRAAEYRPALDVFAACRVTH